MRTYITERSLSDIKMHETEPLWKVCGKLMTSRHGEKESFSDFSSLPFMLVSWPLAVVVADVWERCVTTGGITSIFIYFFIFMLNKYLTPSIFYIAKSIIHFPLQHDFLIYQKVWDFWDFHSFNTQPYEIRQNAFFHTVFFHPSDDRRWRRRRWWFRARVNFSPTGWVMDWWTGTTIKPAENVVLVRLGHVLNAEYMLLCKRSHGNHSHENVVKSLSINGTKK